ncbi:hypothetical protein D9M72_526430 [compost metagenome]
MDVADGGAVGKAVPVVLRRLVIKRLQVERQRIHADRTVRLEGPLGPRPVTIDLDAVAFRIGEIDCFTDEVVGSALQADIVVGGMGEPTSEFLAVGNEKGRMEETGCVSWRSGRISGRGQRQQRAAADAQRLAAGALVEWLQPHDALIPLRYCRQVLHHQMRMIDMRRHRQCVIGRNVDRLRVLRGRHPLPPWAPKPSALPGLGFVETAT